MSQEKKPSEGNKRTEVHESTTPLGVPIVPDDGDGLTNEEREKINEALRSGEAQRLAADATIKLDVVDTDAQQLYSGRVSEKQAPGLMFGEPQVLSGWTDIRDVERPVMNYAEHQHPTVLNVEGRVLSQDDIAYLQQLQERVREKGTSLSFVNLRPEDEAALKEVGIIRAEEEEALAEWRQAMEGRLADAFARVNVEDPAGSAEEVSRLLKAEVTSQDIAGATRPMLSVEESEVVGQEDGAHAALEKAFEFGLDPKRFVVTLRIRHLLKSENGSS